MTKITKTNALRMLDSANIKYEIREYDSSGPLDGVSVANQLGENVESVFKTLVTTGTSGQHYVFCIPVAKTLDLKKCAKAVGEKAIEMLPQKQLLPLTGYVHGGCSPVGMKKAFPTILQEDSILLDSVYVSAGKIGLQMHVQVNDLCKITAAKICDVIREEI